LVVLVGCRKSPQLSIFRNGGSISVVMNIWVLRISVVVLMCILQSFWYLSVYFVYILCILVYIQFNSRFFFGSYYYYPWRILVLPLART
jgi:hypothetical protein